MHCRFSTGKDIDPTILAMLVCPNTYSVEPRHYRVNVTIGLQVSSGTTCTPANTLSMGFLSRVSRSGRDAVDGNENSAAHSLVLRALVSSDGALWPRSEFNSPDAHQPDKRLYDDASRQIGLLCEVGHGCGLSCHGIEHELLH